MIGALAKLDIPWHAKVAYIGTQIHERGAQADVRLEHIFEPGVYIREMVIPADTVFIGRPHRFGHHVQFVSGQGRLIAEHGETLVVPPWHFFTRPGWITVLHTTDEMVLRTIHPNPDNCRDVHLMEGLIFHPPEDMQLTARLVGHQLRFLT